MLFKTMPLFNSIVHGTSQISSLPKYGCIILVSLDLGKVTIKQAYYFQVSGLAEWCKIVRGCAVRMKPHDFK